MPRITKEHMKESIIPFLNDALRIITENINLDANDNREDVPPFEEDGWYYYLYKSIAHIKPEIRIKRQNYKEYKDQPKGNRINEQAWVYKEGMNYKFIQDKNGIIYQDKDRGFIQNGFSFQDYKKTAF